ncbi:hypothetical protein [Stenotrophomonas maltophilia]|uniref:hypothetical protein n=1 Tax=Stenotrophomonas maltophilia TaxID=40324 RepID=UPI000A5B1B0E|nr:hypothetical protein [Stenotrophomonas maltophilia]
MDPITLRLRLRPLQAGRHGAGKSTAIRASLRRGTCPADAGQATCAASAELA